MRHYMHKELRACTRIFCVDGAGNPMYVQNMESLSFRTCSSTVHLGIFRESENCIGVNHRIDMQIDFGILMLLDIVTLSLMNKPFRLTNITL